MKRLLSSEIGSWAGVVCLKVAVNPSMEAPRSHPCERGFQADHPGPAPSDAIHKGQ
jgi:hypothetical protein